MDLCVVFEPVPELHVEECSDDEEDSGEREDADASRGREMCSVHKEHLQTPRSESAVMRVARLRRTMPAQSPANAARSHATDTVPVFSEGKKT